MKPESVGTLPSYVIASVEPRTLSSVTEQLRKEQGVRLVAPTSGRHNLVVQFNSIDSAKVYQFVSRLHSMNGVRRTRTLIPFEGYLTERKAAPGEALAFTFLSVKEQPGKVLEQMKQAPIHSAYIVPGEFDIIATISGRDHNEVLERVARIAEIPGVEGSETVFAYKPIWVL
jgi:DNA-binding Lrp family transcriptional regulator